MSNVIFIQLINPFKKNGDYNPKLTSSAPTDPKVGGGAKNPNTPAGGTANVGDGAGGVETIIAPLLEDFNLNIETTFGTASELIPSGIANILNLVKTLTTLGGQRGENSITDIMDVPIWQGTKPVSFSVKLGFFVESDPYNDVWRPIMGLASLAMLTPTDNKSVFYLPGINLANLGLTLSSIDDQTKFKAGKVTKSYIKLISVEVPGIISLPYAMIDKPNIQFSAELTDTGWPLWGTIELPIQGIIPASTEQFKSMPIVQGANAGGGPAAPKLGQPIKSSGHFTDQLLSSINASKAEENFSLPSDNP